MFTSHAGRGSTRRMWIKLAASVAAATACVAATLCHTLLHFEAPAGAVAAVLAETALRLLRTRLPHQRVEQRRKVVVFVTAPICTRFAAAVVDARRARAPASFALGDTSTAATAFDASLAPAARRRSRRGAGRGTAAAATCNHGSVFGAAGSYLRAPQSRFHVGGGVGPLLVLKVAHKRRKPGEGAEVERHISNDILNIAAHGAVVRNDSSRFCGGVAQGVLE